MSPPPPPSKEFLEARRKRHRNKIALKVMIEFLNSFTLNENILKEGFPENQAKIFADNLALLSYRIADSMIEQGE